MAMILIWSTLPKEEMALQLGQQLVEEQLVACAHLLPAGRSVYRWQGALQQEVEWTLLLKTRESLYSQVERRLRELHPYEVPEIMATAVVQVWQGYLDWVQASAPEQSMENA
ncbi:MAG: divalent-cation tolerance protein CutA [Magnetococcales bacterium]|nr:divalent-cation tolerance protein CutA [Magnetococcales bacterium]MBF0114471.1 divalent-cation tolerance protein CutA [Magnetococcales bacterium]